MPSACDSLVDDIEDMVTSHDPTPHERQFSRRNIVPRPRKHKLQPAGEELQTDSVIPGTQKVWVRTWGCSHNSSDGEYMAGQLAASGYKITVLSRYGHRRSQTGPPPVTDEPISHLLVILSPIGKEIPSTLSKPQFCAVGKLDVGERAENGAVYRGA
ncbi:threonylcarbamoyladenosine tRNA methylthiotransferase [Labeo rohita]|uniref:Threonylcarbamoyladenosine tRNA methylthiotransferase n=1 Tax=Labeo rohita TaxID=84645 RepID=A0A498NU46_LABRO|nr:threonylcarbamoyladenosine tRNA methylthiotransferase [Labeo rohita]